MFQKPATTIDWQIEKLIERGLQIENKELAKKLEAEVIGWMKRQNDSFLDNWLKEANNE